MEFLAGIFAFLSGFIERMCLQMYFIEQSYASSTVTVQFTRTETIASKTCSTTHSSDHY